MFDQIFAKLKFVQQELRYNLILLVCMYKTDDREKFKDKLAEWKCNCIINIDFLWLTA
jgi:hypothetical protein